MGEPWDDALIQSIVDEKPVKVLLCDSTNVFSTHAGRSESTLQEPLSAMIKSQGGMVVATTFGSNVARLKSLAAAARAADRSICVLGRSMKRMLTASTEAGVLKGFPQTVSPEEAAEIPRGNLMLLVTGSQGERRAAAAQLARGKYLGVEMVKGDTFLFSSKTIPGNERDVLRIVNALSEKGVDVFDDTGGLYHVSGPRQPPRSGTCAPPCSADMMIPMHGEHRHLREHAKIAMASGIQSAVVTNGMMMDLTGEEPKVAEYVETGRLYLDGSALIGAMDGVVRDRIRMALNGHVMVTALLDENDASLGDAWVEVMGLPVTGKGGRVLSETLEGDLTEFLEAANAKTLRDDDKLDEALRRIVRQVAMEEVGKKPEVTVVISRLSAE